MQEKINSDHPAQTPTRTSDPNLLHITERFCHYHATLVPEGQALGMDFRNVCKILAATVCSLYVLVHTASYQKEPKGGHSKNEGEKLMKTNGKKKRCRMNNSGCVSGIQFLKVLLRLILLQILFCPFNLQHLTNQSPNYYYNNSVLNCTLINDYLFSLHALFTVLRDKLAVQVVTHFFVNVMSIILHSRYICIITHSSVQNLYCLSVSWIQTQLTSRELPI